MTLAFTAEPADDADDHSQDWAIVDVETSGLLPAQDRVLSVAVVTVDPDGRRTAEYSTLLDPGCDPGPVHIHGLTAERLRGAPDFGQIAKRVATMLEGRVMVAHNAHFDYAFLAGEFARAGLRLPVAQRLCTLALNRRLGPPTTDLRLSTLAAHYGIRQRRAHDALDDSRVLAGILEGSLAEARRLGLPLPLVACPPAKGGRTRYTRADPKVPCAFRNPGRLPLSGPLVQGMKIAITGDTATPRSDLVSRSVTAGLNVMGSVSRFTSAVVANDPGSGSTKARRAISDGVPVIDERAFLRLLDDVRPGTPHTEPAEEATADGRPGDRLVPTPATIGPPPAPHSTAAAVHAGPSSRQPTDPQPAGAQPAEAQPYRPEPVGARRGGPLAGRRVLVLGGTHAQASSARGRVADLGGSAAVNLSASVTDVVGLPGCDTDRRMRRITALDLPVHGPAWLQAPGPEQGTAGAVIRQEAPLILPMGAVIDLPVMPGAALWTISASWTQQTTCEIDVVAFILDEDEQVSCDEDFVFYGAPESPDGAVRIITDGPVEQSVTVDTATLPAAVRKVLIAAAIDGAAAFGDIGAIEIAAAPGTGERVLAQATLDAATTEQTLLLAEVYRRGPSWRLRAIGQGHDHGLHQLARHHGVDVEA